MTSQQWNTLSDAERQVTIQELLQEQMRLAIRRTFITDRQISKPSLLDDLMQLNYHSDKYYRSHFPQSRSSTQVLVGAPACSGISLVKGTGLRSP